jgi:hypothetical protein
MYSKKERTTIPNDEVLRRVTLAGSLSLCFAFAGFFGSFLFLFCRTQDNRRAGNIRLKWRIRKRID